MKIGFVSLGCSKNLVDTEVMLGITVKEGWTVVNDPADAEVVVINTCSFIEEARKEAHQTILEFSDYKKRGVIKKLIVAGCLPQRYRTELPKKYPMIDKFIGSSDFPSIVKFIQEDPELSERVVVSRPDFIYSFGDPRVNTLTKGSAYVKVAEGCSERCTFCIVPKLRGRFRSRAPDDVEREVASLARNGVLEINLIAQNLTAYGKDLAGSVSLTSLLERLCRIDRVRWIRLLYNYPGDFSKDLIDLVANKEKIVNYVDLPLQHIDDEILRRMGREDSKTIMKLLDKLKERIDDLVLRTSFIVGFPGETRNKFQKLMRFAREYEFDKIAVFPYSREHGTAAYKLGGGADGIEKALRYDALMELKKQIAITKNERFVGRVFDVIVEGHLSGKKRPISRGRFYGQAPEVDGFVYFDSGEVFPEGKCTKVKFHKADAYDFYGEAV